MLLLILNVLTEVSKKECFLLQKVTCSTEQWGFPNMKGMVLHQSFRRHFFFVYYQERKSDRTELTGRGEAKDGGNRWDRTTGRNLVDGDPLIEVSAPCQWSALQLGAWRLSRCLLRMNQKMVTICQFAPQKISSGQREVGNFFFEGLNEMKWLTVLPKKMCTFPCLYLICRNPEFLLGIFLERAPEYM